MSKEAQDQTSRNILRANVERDYKNAKPQAQHTPGPWNMVTVGSKVEEPDNHSVIAVKNLEKALQVLHKAEGKEVAN